MFEGFRISRGILFIEIDSDKVSTDLFDVGLVIFVILLVGFDFGCSPKSTFGLIPIISADRNSAVVSEFQTFLK